jgi:hypothetical protein
MQYTANAKKRSWFRFHLVTVTVLTLTASLFLGLNIGREHTYTTVWDENGASVAPRTQTYRLAGWPIRCVVFACYLRVYKDHSGEVAYQEPVFSYTALFADILLCLLGLISVAWACEFIIRRREQDSSASVEV